MLERLEAFVKGIVDHLRSRTKPLGAAVKRELTRVLVLAADRIEQLKAALEPEAIDQADVAQEVGQLKATAEPKAIDQVDVAQEVGQEADAATLLWILSGGDEDAFVNYISTFPDPDLGALLRDPQRLQQTITDLQNAFPGGIGAGEVKDGIPHQALQSSNIFGFQFDPKSNKLKVRFQGGGVYEYFGVPQQVFRIFQAGAVPAKTTGRNEFGRWWTGKLPSSGAAFHKLIKLGGYTFRKVL